MTLHCPFCGAPLVGDFSPTVCGDVVCCVCQKQVHTDALMAAVGFPLLGADERWRTETCGTCRFWKRIRQKKQEIPSTGYVPAWEPEGGCLRYPQNESKDNDFAACAEWWEKTRWVHVQGGPLQDGAGGPGRGRGSH